MRTQGDHELGKQAFTIPFLLTAGQAMLTHSPDSPDLDWTGCGLYLVPKDQDF